MKEPYVLILAYPFPPVGLAGTFRVLRFVKYLPSFGWKPLIVTIRAEDVPDYGLDQSLSQEIPPLVVVRRARVLRPFQTVGSWAKSALRALCRRANVNAADTSSSVPSNGQRGRRRMDRLRSIADTLLATPDGCVGWILPAFWASLGLIRLYRPRAILSTGPPHSAHLVAVLLKLTTGVPIFLDLRDPWGRSSWDSNGGSALRRQIQRALERTCVHFADRVILNTPELLEEFCSAYKLRLHSRFCVIPNGFDPELFDKLPKRNEVDRCGSNGTTTLCHPGTVYGKRDLRPVLEAIYKLRAAGTKVILDQVGSIENEADVVTKIQQLGLADTVFLRGQVSHTETLKRMAAADAFLLLQPGTGTQVPGKLFEMLAFDRPILALTDGNGSTANLMHRFGLGSVVPPSDVSAIAEAVAKSTVPNEFGRDENLQDVMELFDGRALSGKLAGLFDACDKNEPLVDVNQVKHS